MYENALVKEYYDLKKMGGKECTSPTIGAVIMMKNEKKRLHVTLKSILGFVQALIVYDTGSTDNTIDIVKEFAEKHRTNLYLITGEFVDFSTSRNVLLNYADTINVDYLLHLDVNDELVNGKELHQYAKTFIKEKNEAFLVCQQWWGGITHDKYYNVRFVKNRTGWRYHGSVHEWLADTKCNSTNTSYPVIRFGESPYLYQDRTQDDDKSMKRFKRDKEFLLNDFHKDPTDSRTVFYLAQTCCSLGHLADAYYYSRLRSEMEGFLEEKYLSYYRCGLLGEALGHDWEHIMPWYLKAYEYTCTTSLGHWSEFTPRIEPLLKIAEYYVKKQNWNMAYMFCKQACDQLYPEKCILFVEKSSYTYLRWYLLSVIAHNVRKTDEGKKASMVANAQNIDQELNRKILNMYEEEEKGVPFRYIVIQHPKMSDQLRTVDSLVRPIEPN